MTPEEQSAASGAAAPNPSSRSGPPRRHRGFRPSRRPPRRPSPPSGPKDVPPSDETRSETLEAEPVEESMPAHIAEEPIDEPEGQRGEQGGDPPRQDPSSARRAEAGPAIREAIEQLQNINKDLEHLLLEMQKALETLEEAEVQKYADERDIESLRAALRQLNRTRDSLQRPSQPHSRPDNRSRHPQREQRFQSSHRQRSGPRQQQQDRNAEASRPQTTSPDASAQESPAETPEAQPPEPARDPEHPY